MSSFIFQATTERHDLRFWPSVGQTVDWRAQRYRSLMRPEELVFFWRAGEAEFRGIHGWGHLDSLPYEQDGQFRVKVRFEHRLAPHISAAQLQSDSTLRDLQIFSVRVGSNFLLEPTELEALLRHVPAEQRPQLGG
jgi:hypothetical protein